VLLRFQHFHCLSVLVGFGFGFSLGFLDKRIRLVMFVVKREILGVSEHFRQIRPAFFVPGPPVILSYAFVLGLLIV